MVPAELVAVDRERQVISLDPYLALRADLVAILAVEENRLVRGLDFHVILQYLELHIGGGVLLHLDLGRLAVVILSSIRSPTFSVPTYSYVFSSVSV